MCARRKTNRTRTCFACLLDGTITLHSLFQSLDTFAHCSFERCEALAALCLILAGLSCATLPTLLACSWNNDERTCLRTVYCIPVVLIPPSRARIANPRFPSVITTRVHAARPLCSRKRKTAVWSLHGRKEPYWLRFCVLFPTPPRILRVECSSRDSYSSVVNCSSILRTFYSNYGV